MPASAAPVVARDATASWGDAAKGKGGAPGLNAGRTTVHGVLRIPLGNLRVPGKRPVGTNPTADTAEQRDKVTKKAHSTTEASTNRAIVLVPQALLADPTRLDRAVPIWLHLHGLGLGYRQNESGDSGDQTMNFEEQLAALPEPMIGILPQGTVRGPFFGYATSHPSEYIDIVLAALASTNELPKVPIRGPIALSAHSGGGTQGSAALATPRSLPPELREVILFDAINRYPGSQEYANTAGWLQSRVKADADALAALPGEPERLVYLQTSMRFRGYHSRMPGYTADYDRLDTELQGWLAAADGRIGGAGSPVSAALHANYRIIGLSHSDHGQMMSAARGSKLQEGLALLPTSLAATQQQRTAAAANPTTTTAGTPAGNEAGAAGPATVARQRHDPPPGQAGGTGSGAGTTAPARPAPATGGGTPAGGAPATGAGGAGTGAAGAPAAAQAAPGLDLTGATAYQTSFGVIHRFATMPAATTTARSDRPLIVADSAAVTGRVNNVAVQPAVVGPVQALMDAMHAAGTAAGDASLTSAQVTSGWRPPTLAEGQLFRGAIQHHLNVFQTTGRGAPGGRDRWLRLTLPANVLDMAEEQLVGAGATHSIADLTDTLAAAPGWDADRARDLITHTQGNKAPRGGSPHHSGYVVDINFPIVNDDGSSPRNHAVHFEWNDDARATAAGVWLARNAATYGFASYNTAKEIWHMEWLSWRTAQQGGATGRGAGGGGAAR